MTVVVAEDILLAATVDTAKLPAVSILAYSGGLMTVPGFGAVVIDLVGLDVTGGVALLSDHDSTRRGVIGHGRAEVQGGKVFVNGTISATGPAAREIVDAGKNGFPWQASVGVEVIERRRVAAGETVNVNGQTVKAPAGGFTLVTRGRLREVSIVSLGCDAATSVAIAAGKQKEANMTASVQEKVAGQEQGQPNVEAAETQRIAAIKSVCGGRHSDIEARAVAENWDLSQTELAVLRADRPKAPSVYITSSPVTNVATLEAAVLTRMGRSGLGEKAVGAAAMEQASMLGATSMLDLCRAALIADGVEVPRGRMELVKAALSTISLPTALGNVANKLLLDAYNEMPATWRAFCAIRSVADFKTNTGVRPSFLGGLQPVAPGGELKHGTMAEATLQFAIDTFGKLLSVDRRDIINDDLGVFEDAAAAMGRAAMRKLSDLVFEVLLANANGFFSIGNANLLEGADTALSFDSLAKAILLMRSQKDAENNDLDLLPATLLVGPELEPTARALLNSEYIERAVNLPTGNSLKQAVSLEVESRLANSVKFGAAASGKAWYLFASPSANPMLVAFLNGQQSPTVEYFGLESTVERLAVSWRVYHDFGTVLADPRAAVRSKGQA